MPHENIAEQIFLFSQLWHPSITTKYTHGLSASNTKKLIFDKVPHAEGKYARYVFDTSRLLIKHTKIERPAKD